MSEDHAKSEPVDTLPDLSWVAAPRTTAVMDALEQDGIEARFVGGCVRDAMAKRPINDIDIATTATPDKIEALLARAGIKSIPTGKEHGTIMAVVDHQSFEITTLRVDQETDGRHAKVEFTSDWVLDAARRDFTFNALSANRQGEVFDPFDGLTDLANGAVRFINQASERIAEDYLRILRYFRFHASHGKPPMDPIALQACKQASEHLNGLSGERIQSEMMKLLSSEHCAETLHVMQTNGILDRVALNKFDFAPIKALVGLCTTTIPYPNVKLDPVRNLAILGNDIDQLSKRWRVSNKVTERLKQIQSAPTLSPNDSDLTIKKALYHQGVDLFIDTALITWAEDIALNTPLSVGRSEQWLKLITQTQDWQRPVFPIGGKDVMKQGITVGPKVGEILSQVENWWIDQNFEPDKGACLAYMASLQSGS